ncbi:sodium:solute symporter family protein [Anaeroselena agilis]|uniref:Sodium:solute symporter family protein n=1 Tax=Anaeroselena agilis TaxID=3063788 RepID=A0ABU3P335_9FIRM|nr:sodium:solute symporter family protein [Selenomonadales bacterium 4137-cl]
MSLLGTGHIVGIVVTLALVSAVGIYAGRKVKSAADFSTGNRSVSPALVAGTLMGTLVGGASTIGTAQLAFKFGFSAWWFTLGAGMAVAIMGLWMVRPLWESAVDTLPQYLVKTYGANIGPVSSVFTSIGIFFNLMAQALAFCALVTSMFPMQPSLAAVIGLILVLAYVLFGGVWGTGLTGVVKLILLYLAMLACGITAYAMAGGAEGLMAKLPAHPWFSLFGRGVSKDLAAGFSLIVGVLSTQTYFQALSSAKNVPDARKGALVSALLIPPIGIGGVLVGLYMRINFPDTVSSEVLPVFVLKFLPPVPAGVVLATLLISVVGTWAGLTLGISTMVTKDLYQRYISPRGDAKQVLLVQRGIIVAISLAVLLFVSSNAGSLILGWSFMSMGLRGCTILLPLLGAMFFPGRVTPAAGIAAAVLGPLTNFAWKLAFPAGMDPLYPGLLASLLALVAISLLTRKNTPA